MKVIYGCTRMWAQYARSWLQLREGLERVFSDLEEGLTLKTGAGKAGAPPFKGGITWTRGKGFGKV